MSFCPERLWDQQRAPWDSLGEDWIPMYAHDCTFDTQVFLQVMANLVENPNINSSWLFRADILRDEHDEPLQGMAIPPDNDAATTSWPTVAKVQGWDLLRVVVRRLVPRNEQRDAPMDQTCTFHETLRGSCRHSLVIYRSHVASASEMPFYHPKVCGIAHLHAFDTSSGTGTISLHILPFHGHPIDEDAKMQRTAYHLLEVVDRHGRSKANGYVKRVTHDLIVSRPRFQDRLALLKRSYARALVDTWAEQTDPSKHVFEDLAIAAFLMELWKDMYGNSRFPGFVDIGCGNGLLVHILRREGYSGWGFDARERKSWSLYAASQHTDPLNPKPSLRQHLLLPRIVRDMSKRNDDEAILSPPGNIHDGIFPPGTFIISNHADELTPWTPILATISHCPFIMIPCCSHSLSGSKCRAPPPRDKSRGTSTYASLVDWVARIAEDCGWRIETEALRIPSTRNICLLGRDRTIDYSDVDVGAILDRHGGVDGFFENVTKLASLAPRGH